MNKRFRIHFYLLLLLLTFLKVEQATPVEHLQNKDVPIQFTAQVQDKTVNATAVHTTIVSKFKIKVRYMGGDCSYALVAQPHTYYSFSLLPDVVTGKYTPVLRFVLLGLRSLRGPPVLSVC